MAWVEIGSEEALTNLEDSVYFCVECDERCLEDYTECSRYPKEHDEFGYMGCLEIDGIQVVVKDDNDLPGWAEDAKCLAETAGLEFDVEEVD